MKVKVEVTNEAGNESLNEDHLFVHERLMDFLF